jgi:predicted RNA-binding protein associated with RNAse of E/G family
MYTPERQIAQWYIDVCAGHGVDHRGIPWHDDLYLDIIASGHDLVEVIDAADLDAAYAEDSDIPAIYHQAWRESHRLAPLVRGARLPEMRFAADALAAMLTVERGDVVSGYDLLTSR